jgi:soluble lytic murein transglycosylase-like protein
VRAALLLAASVAAVTALPAPAEAGTSWPGHPDRSLVRHTVRSGETATGLAVRYHAWTDELVRLNHLGAGAGLRLGQVVRIPVVVSAAQHAASSRRPTRSATSGPLWRHADLSRRQVRRVIVSVARRNGVPPRLALAVAWQESGWQQRRVSAAGALGVMQVMPDTGRWMRWYAGRPLRLRDTHDNVLAGVLTLRVLRAATFRDDRAIAAYYQGLGALRERGFFDDTRTYVSAVRAHERRLARTGSPV